MGGLSQAEYRGRVFGLLFDYAVAGANDALLVSYPELPDAVRARILPHLGHPLKPGDEERLRIAGERDAKSPAMTFTSHPDPSERPQWTAELPGIALRWAGEAYRELEKRRAEQKGSRPRS